MASGAERHVAEVAPAPVTYLRVLRQSRQLVPWVEKDLDSPVDLPAKGRTVVAFEDDLIALQSERKRKVSDADDDLLRQEVCFCVFNKRFLGSVSNS